MSQIGRELQITLQAAYREAFREHGGAIAGMNFSGSTRYW